MPKIHGRHTAKQHRKFIEGLGKLAISPRFLFKDLLGGKGKPFALLNSKTIAILLLVCGVCFFASAATDSSQDVPDKVYTGGVSIVMAGSGYFWLKRLESKETEDK